MEATSSGDAGEATSFPLAYGPGAFWIGEHARLGRGFGVSPKQSLIAQKRDAFAHARDGRAPQSSATCVNDEVHKISMQSP